MTVKEFRSGLRSLNVTVQDDMVAALVTLMDRDGDGEIDYRAFIPKALFSARCSE